MTNQDDVRKAGSTADFRYDLVPGDAGERTAVLLRVLSRKEAVVIPESLEGCPVRTIGARAFESHPLRSVVFPAGLETIGRGAFRNCRKLARIDLPSSLRVLRAGAFLGCTGLREAVLPEGLRELGTADPSRWEPVLEGVFEGCTNLEAVRVPDSVVVMGRRTFQGCARLKRMDLPRHIIRI